jgi:2-amino-4-hydroxy-6-hydroxymethyldihydropteridine diphosphokinase
MQAAREPSPQPSPGVPGEGEKRVAHVAIGSNLGDRKENIEAAIHQLKDTPRIRVTKRSSLLENPAVGGATDSPPFLNAVIEVETTLTARELLVRLLAIEIQLGRERRQKWEPRIIDLDLVLYGDAIIDEDDLNVPHPLMHQRAFVLKPLLEIAPYAVHPVFRQTIAQLANAAGIT